MVYLRVTGFRSREGVDQERVADLRVVGCRSREGGRSKGYRVYIKRGW